MLGRVVVGVKRLDVDRPVLDFVADLVADTGSEVLVVHVRERLCSKSGPSFLETNDQASCVVEEAVFELRMAGIGASGRVTSTLEGRVVQALVDEASACTASAIVVGRHRRRGLRRLLRSDRERLLRLSSLPVMLAPVPSGRSPSTRALDRQVRSHLARWPGAPPGLTDDVTP